MVEVVLGNEQEAAPKPQEQRTMPAPVQDVASGLEQVDVPELELQDALEQEEVGRLLLPACASKRVRRRFMLVFMVARDCSNRFILSSVLSAGTAGWSCGG